MRPRVRAATIDFVAIMFVHTFGIGMFALVFFESSFNHGESAIILLCPVLLVALVESGSRCSIGKYICGFRVRATNRTSWLELRLVSRGLIKYLFILVFVAGLFVPLPEQWIFCAAFFTSLFTLIVTLFLLLDGLAKYGQAFYDVWLGLGAFPVKDAEQTQGFPIIGNERHTSK